MTLDEQSQMILDVWLLFVDFIPVKQRKELAFNFFKILSDSGIDFDHAAALIKGEDKYLDKAFDEFCEENSEIDEDEL